MIPTIEQICDDLKVGKITLLQAMKYLEIHKDIGRIFKNGSWQ